MGSETELEGLASSEVGLDRLCGLLLGSLTKDKSENNTKDCDCHSDYKQEQGNIQSILRKKLVKRRKRSCMKQSV